MATRTQNDRSTPAAPYQTKVRSVYPDLGRAERKVADFVLRRPEAILSLSVRELADRLGVSDATTVRFCQRAGYTGFYEFKILLARDLGAAVHEQYPEIEEADDPRTIVQKTLLLSVRSLEDTRATLHIPSLQAAARSILAARTVHVYGAGGSGGVATIAQQRLLRIGIRCVTATDPHVQPLLAAQLTARDTAMGISHSGRTEDIVHALAVARKHGARTIVITNYRASPISKVADLLLLTGVRETPLASEGGPTRVAQVAAVDVLCSLLVTLQRRR